MASPDSDNSEEYLFLDLELLSALSIPQNSAELKSTVQEINEALSEQLVEIKNLKSQYRTLKEKVKTTAKTNEEMNLEIATLKDELQADERALEKMKSQGRNISQKSTLDLCYTLTKLKWNTDCPKNVVAGVVIGKTDVETFKFDSDKNSDAFICSHLWNLLENAAGL